MVHNYIIIIDSSTETVKKKLKRSGLPLTDAPCWLIKKAKLSQLALANYNIISDNRIEMQNEKQKQHFRLDVEFSRFPADGKDVAFVNKLRQKSFESDELLDGFFSNTPYYLGIWKNEFAYICRRGDEESIAKARKGFIE